jgi:arylsulfatase A-like enzyme
VALRGWTTKRSNALAVLAAAVWVVAGLAGGCVGVPDDDGTVNTFGIDFAGANPVGERGAVIFFVDGLNATVFQEMLDAGELPAIRKYFVDRGLYAPRAVANIPSVTLANETSLVTGLFAGHHGILGVNWFDRNSLVWRDYAAVAQKNALDGDYFARNLYECFPDRMTFSLFFQAHRHATEFVENRLTAGPTFVIGAYEYVDRLALFRFHTVADAARRSGRFPAITVAYSLAPDFQAYDHGVEAPAYREAIRHTDRQVGRVLGDLERGGVLKDLYIVLLSDHGHSPVQHHFVVSEYLRRQLGLAVAPGKLWEESDFLARLAHYSQYAAVVYGSGDRYNAICLRRPLPAHGGAGAVAYDGWTSRPSAEDLAHYPTPRGTVDLPAKLAELPCVDALAYAAGADRVRVRRARGEVEFHQGDGPGGTITYRVISGQDPLGWSSAVPQEALSGKGLTPRQWLLATVNTDFPDLPAQIVAYFRARTAGDIALFAAPMWDFNRVHRSGHGSLRGADMHVPLLLAGPGIPCARLPVARTADVMPTILGLLGRPVPAGLDGQSLVKVLPPATQAK